MWALRRPGMLISVVGSDAELDLKPEQQRKLGGIMSVAVETSAWITTTGVDSGVSKLLAELRKDSDNQVHSRPFAHTLPLPPSFCRCPALVNAEPVTWRCGGGRVSVREEGREGGKGACQHTARRLAVPRSVTESRDVTVFRVLRRSR